MKNIIEKNSFPSTLGISSNLFPTDKPISTIYTFPFRDAMALVKFRRSSGGTVRSASENHQYITLAMENPLRTASPLPLPSCFAQLYIRHFIFVFIIYLLHNFDKNVCRATFYSSRPFRLRQPATRIFYITGFIPCRQTTENYNSASSCDLAYSVNLEK